MVKHTKGPWKYEHENGSNPRIVSPAIDPGTGKPCVVVNLTCAMRAAGPVETCNDETEANAILMAGAPAMLAALKIVLEYPRLMETMMRPQDAAAIRSAIAKAEGSSE